MPADAVASSPSVSDLQQQIDELGSSLRESEVRLALVRDAVSEGIYEWNIETNALWQSQRLREIFGLAGRELKAADWNELVHPEDFEDYRKALRDCFRGTVERLDCEYRVKHTDGSYRWLEDRAVPVRNPAGRAVRLVGAVTDVTSRKESEQALREALEQQTATSEVLEVINSSPGDLNPVFQTMLEKALRLCEAAFGVFWTYDGERFHASALLGVPQDFADFATRAPHTVGRDNLHSRALRGEAVMHIEDAAASDAYHAGDPLRRALVDLGGARTSLGIALRKDDVLLGVLVLYRQEVRPFTDRQVTLLENFATQAVIAMENARLLGELRQRTDDLTESLEYQTATSEVLEVISRSTSDIQPVLDSMVAAASRLCDAPTGTMAIRRGDVFRHVATIGLGPVFDKALRERPLLPSRGTISERVLLEKQVVHVADLEADPDYPLRDAARTDRLRTALGVPLMREGQSLGVFVLARDRIEPFTERQIALVKTFADQAVIAMENARLLAEQREALEQQTATAEVLQVINSSPGDLQPVFKAMLEKAMRLCGADFGDLRTYDGVRFHMVASQGVPAAYSEYYRNQTGVYGPGTAPARILSGEDVVHVFDLLDTDAFRRRDPDRVALVELGGARTSLTVPLRKAKAVVGFIMIYRQEVKAFDEKQVALLQNFAAQAVIAIENARLFEELRDRQAELRTTFDNIGDGVVMFDDELRLAAWNRNFQALLDVSDDFLTKRPSYDEYVRMLIERGEFGSVGREAETRRLLRDVGRQWSRERIRPDGRVIEVRNNPVPGGGTVAIYADITKRKQAEAEIRAARDAAEAALERQTATADILKVIASSPTDVRPVLDAVAKAARRFCSAADAVISLREGDEFVRAAHEGSMPSVLGRSPLDRSSISGLAIIDGRTLHIPDIRSLNLGELATSQSLAADSGARAVLAAPMLREGIAVGCIMLRRASADSFAPAQIELLEAFAAQAVIAIENVRLFTELKESLEQQTASSEILQVISQSPTDVTPVLNAVARAAVRFCGAEDATISLQDGEELTLAAHEGPIDTEEVGRRYPLDGATIRGQAIIDGRTIHVQDATGPEGAQYGRTQELARRLGFHAVLAAPMLREEEAIGSIALRKSQPGSFTPRQIELLETFAAQAVIAIENVRLFTELRESLDQQTATAQVLRAISQSPTDVQPVLDVVLDAALQFCGASDVMIALREGNEVVVSAHKGKLERTELVRFALGGGHLSSQVILGGVTLHVPDIEALDPAEFAGAREMARRYGWRAAVAAPMIREGVAAGAILLRKPDVGGFTPRQIELLETFAAQAVIAIENVRLFTELRDSLERLKAAQANLIQSEKMASLGQLTAGIAHEIKNPLNFVNNFAGLSGELVTELGQIMEALLAEPDDEKRAELQDTIDLLTGNLAKIVEHGQRADGIVKSMLAHSRGGTGDWQTSNINNLVEEALNLAYHGARAQDQAFNVTLERDFGEALKPIDVVPQDVTRVFLNLFGNGFYAARKRQSNGADSSYRPRLRVSTRDLGEAIEIRVLDNGTGISSEVRTKLFQPFFTTKPTGEGTGLGLSISYDIVTQQHGGSIEVESELGQFSEFIVRLPRAQRVASRGQQ
jgi:PAS domain S-box-containing protein